MRRALAALAGLVVAGCGPAPAPAAIPPGDWSARDASELGVHLEIPPGWDCDRASGVYVLSTRPPVDDAVVVVLRAAGDLDGAKSLDAVRSVMPIAEPLYTTRDAPTTIAGRPGRADAGTGVAFDERWPLAFTVTHAGADKATLVVGSFVRAEKAESYAALLKAIVAKMKALPVAKAKAEAKPAKAPAWLRDDEGDGSDQPEPELGEPLDVN